MSPAVERSLSAATLLPGKAIVIQNAVHTAFEMKQTLDWVIFFASAELAEVL